MKEIVLPWPSAHLSPNSRKHWTARKKAAKEARQLAWGIAREAGWTGDGLPSEGRLHLWVDFYPPTRIGIDDDNALSRCKAYRDGIADALGINDKRFVSHPYVHDEVRKGGEVRVRITVGPDAALAAVGLTGIVGETPRESSHAPEPDRS